MVRGLRFERVITINHYYEVQEIRFGKVERFVIFRGKPTPIMHQRQTHRVVAYKGLSVQGKPKEFRGIAHWPEYKVIDLGEQPDPKFNVGQVFDFAKNNTKRPQEIMSIAWGPNSSKCDAKGWVYRGLPVDRHEASHLPCGECWISEQRMKNRSEITLVNG